MSLITQVISFSNSMDLDSQPKPMSKLISLISQKTSLVKATDLDSEFLSLLEETLELEPEPELMSLIHQIVSLVILMNSKREKLISLGPQLQVSMEEEKFHVDEEVSWSSDGKWDCVPFFWDKFILRGEDITHFHCTSCNGHNHEEYDKAPVQIKYYLHPKHSLQLVLFDKDKKTRECHCCDEDLKEAFYYCSSCDFVINLACVEKPPILSIDHPKWHDHTLALFPRHASLTYNLCALAVLSSPFYMCLPCDFVVHQTCLNLPRVIRISRHDHCISFTHSFDQGDRYCGVFCRNIDNDYGCYYCIKDGCSYAAHSRCATQKNVWDGEDLEREPEEIEEEVEPFVSISEGIIQHFSHRHHHLKLDENTDRDYDEDKQCQACITPIYFGNFYSCMKCGFLLHEACTNFPCKIHHSIHPHLLTLMAGYDDIKDNKRSCSTCPSLSTAGFFYECSKDVCFFRVHVQYATICEPLDHKSHMHPLFLTSKPGERRACSVCKASYYRYQETFNCIECDGFALCFKCVTLPQKVRYKHDKHMLTLYYGEETNTIMTNNWCEVCEEKIDLNKRFYV